MTYVTTFDNKNIQRESTFKDIGPPDDLGPSDDPNRSTV